MRRSHWGFGGLGVAFLGLSAFGLTGCLYGPFYDDTIPSTTSSVNFGLWATQPNVTVTAECATHYSGFSQFGSVVSSSTPFTYHGESIYSASLTRVIPASCWDYGWDKPLTYLRFFQQGSDGFKGSVQVFDSSGRTCISNHFSSGDGPISAGWACRKTDSDTQLRLYAQH